MKARVGPYGSCDKTLYQPGRSKWSGEQVEIQMRSIVCFFFFFFCRGANSLVISVESITVHMQTLKRCCFLKTHHITLASKDPPSNEEKNEQVIIVILAAIGSIS